MIHNDTNNLHIHIAINKIHPTKHTIHNPFFDYKKVAQLCTQIEHEYDLTIVNHEAGRDASKKETEIETKAGVESLIGWIKRECLDEIKCADNWQDLHQALKQNGLEIKERGNGFVFKSNNGIAVKASSVDRSLSKGNLIKRLGEFEYIDDSINPQKPSDKQYQPRSVHTKQDTTCLFAQYQREQREAATGRAEQWAILRSKRDLLIERAKKEQKLKRSIIKNIHAERFAKKMMASAAYQQFKATIDIIKEDYQKAYQASKTKHSRMAWLDWLVKEAGLGDTEALEILRSRKTNYYFGNNVSGKNNNAEFIKDSFIEAITKHGAVIYKTELTTVRDDGNRLIVSPDTSNEALADILQIAIHKYGNHLAINGTEQFRTHIAQVAVHNKMSITFDDKALEQHRQQLIKQQALSRFQKPKITPTTAKRISI